MCKFVIENDLWRERVLLEYTKFVSLSLEEIAVEVTVLAVNSRKCKFVIIAISKC
jgi:hypothetical protein